MGVVDGLARHNPEGRLVAVTRATSVEASSAKWLVLVAFDLPYSIINNVSLGTQTVDGVKTDLQVAQPVFTLVLRGTFRSGLRAASVPAMVGRRRGWEIHACLSTPCG